MILLGVQFILIKGISIISSTEKKSKTQATSIVSDTLQISNLLQTTLKGHALTVTSAAITADNNTIISGSKDNTIKLWNLVTGQLKRTLIGHTGVVDYLNVTTDGKYIVSADSKNVRIWNLLTGALIREIKNLEPVSFIKITQDGKTLVVDGDTQIIKNTKTEVNAYGYKSSSEVEIKKYIINVFNLNTGVLKNKLVHNESFTSVKISRSGNILVSGNKTGKLNIWNLQNGRLQKTLTGHNSTINSIAISPDEKTIVSTEEDGQIKIWDLSSGKLKSTFTGHDSIYGSVIVLISNDTLVSWLKKYKTDVKIWNLQTGEFKYTLKLPKIENSHGLNNINLINFSSDGKNLITYDDDGIQTWELTTGKLKNTVKIQGDILAVSPNNKIVATSEGASDINIYKIPSDNDENK
jgi:WD40 repeat protein